MSNKLPTIRYTARDFQTIRKLLEEHGDRYYPDSFKDRTKAGHGALMLDTVSIVGDILSFYLDYEVNESFLDTAVEFNNIVRLSKRLGYKYTNAYSSTGTQTFYLIVPADSNGTPDVRYCPIMKRGAELTATNGNGFILNEDIDWSDDDLEVVVARVNTTTGQPTYFAKKAFAQIISGRLVEELVVIGEHQPFRRIELSTSNVSEIIDLRDDEGNSWWEVDALTQDVVYREISNRSESGETDRILRPYATPRRFVVEQERDKTFLQFGFGSENDTTIDPFLDPSTTLMKIYGKDYTSSNEFDPYKLLKTDKLGISPANTTLRVISRVNDRNNVNASRNSITKISNAVFVFQNQSTLDRNLIQEVQASIETTNDEQIIGSVSSPTTQEIKFRAQGAFSSQSRAVTEQDYQSIAYRMPAKFGAIKRCRIVQDKNSFKRNLNLYVISEDAEGRLVESNNTLKNNLKTWIERYKMINDTIDILDAKIINFGIEYIVTGELGINKYEIQNRCNIAMKKLYAIHQDISENLSISNIFKTLNDVEGVVDVVSVKIVPKVGGSYSGASFDFEKNTLSNGRFLRCPKNCIFELKYPNTDIIGVVK